MNHLQRYLVDEFVEDYQEGTLSRRQALKRIAGITGVAAATQILAACGQPTQSTAAAPTTGVAPTTAPVATSPATAVANPQPTAYVPVSQAIPNSVLADDPTVVAEHIEFPAADGQALGYLARPAADGTYPIVLVCHENRGLTPHIEDVTRRVAKAGYLGLAVDLLWREGGIARISDPDSIPGLLSNAPPERHVQDFRSGLEYAKTQPSAQADSAGMVGFCFGGGVTWLVAAGIPEIRAAVPFYGPPAPAEQIPNINAAVLAIYAEQDARITSTEPQTLALMQENNKTFQRIIYPGVNHAFHNDTGERYNAEAAQAAWAETLKWFEQYLKAA